MSQVEPKISQEVITAISATWADFPEMRLGQLLVNVLGASTSAEVFYAEDSVLIRKLEEFRTSHAGNRQPGADS